MYNCVSARLSGLRGKEIFKLLMRLFFIPVSSPYDDEKSTAHYLSLTLNLSSIPEVKMTTTNDDKGEEVKEKSYAREG